MSMYLGVFWRALSGTYWLRRNHGYACDGYDEQDEPICWRVRHGRLASARMALREGFSDVRFLCWMRSRPSSEEETT